MNYFDGKKFVQEVENLRKNNMDFEIDFLQVAEKSGLDTTNWLHVLSIFHIKEIFTKDDLVIKYAATDEFAECIVDVTRICGNQIIREYMEQRIKPNEQRKFLDRCLAELNYYAATYNKHDKQFFIEKIIEQQKHIIESLKQIVANRPTTATQAQSPNASEQTPQVTTAKLTEGNKHTIKEIVRWFNNYDAFKGKFDEQQIIECVEHADFNPVYTDRQKVWVRDLICTIKKNLPIDANIFTQIAQNLGFQNMSQLSKSRGKHKKYSSTN